MRPAALLAGLASGVLALAAAAGAAGQAAPGAPGAPDPAFGEGGLASSPFGGGARAAAAAIGPDGTIAVAGDLRGAGGEGSLVARYTPGGALDATFAGGGSRLDRFGPGGPAPQRAGAVAVAPDGATIVAGVAGEQIAVARYLPGGALDGRFGAGGVVLRDLSGGGGMPDGAGLAALALLPTGEIVVAGSTGVPSDDPYGEGEPGEQVVVGRLSARGVPDPAFGSGGFALIQLGARGARRPARSRAAALATSPDGAIALAGRASAPDGSSRGFVARLTASGRLDRRFARAGRVLAQLGRASAARRADSRLDALVADRGGTLLAAGQGTDVGGFRQAVLVRLTAGGALDASFGRGGVVRTQLGAGSRAPWSAARALAPTPQGVVVAGSGGDGAAVAARLTPSGRLDCSFDAALPPAPGAGRGAALRPAPGAGRGDPASGGAFGAVAQPDGAIVLAGRLPAGGLLLGRLLGGAGAGPAPARRAVLRTLAARRAGRRRAFAYGLVEAGCAGARVHFVARPLRWRGRPVASRAQTVARSVGGQVVCARLRGLAPGRAYRVRIEPASGAARPRGASVVLRPGPPARRARAQSGCS